MHNCQVGQRAGTAQAQSTKVGRADVVLNLILSAHGGRWGSFFLVIFMTFILRMFTD